jgi:hypothetical protein
MTYLKFDKPFEEIPHILSSHEQIKYEGFIAPDKDGFSRIVRFQIRGVTYEIKIFGDVSYLYCGEMRVLFNWFTIDRAGLSGFKTYLWFYKDDVTCAVIPLEEHPENCARKRPPLPCELGKENNNEHSRKI